MKTRCIAEGYPGAWEAVCLDFDIAVQGASFDEVNRSLCEAIQLYLEEIEAYPEAERARLLKRKAPLSLRLKFAWHVLRNSGGGDIERRDWRLQPPTAA